MVCGKILGHGETCVEGYECGQCSKIKELEEQLRRQTDNGSVVISKEDYELFQKRVNTTFKHDDGYTITTFEMNTDQADVREMFMHWVRFMNAIGYVLNSVEMEEMWNERYI